MIGEVPYNLSPRAQRKNLLTQIKRCAIYDTTSVSLDEMIMDRKFEKFLGGPTQSPSDRVYISINKANVITLNEKCYKLLGTPPAVYLFFSRADDTIAIEPVHSHPTPASFPVKTDKNRSSWRISAAPFCKHFGIRIDTTERFIAPDMRDGSLQMKLTETVTVRNYRRKKK